jgi:hypothetical protein
MHVTCLFFIPEDGGGTFLQNVGGLLKNTRRYNPENRNMNIMHLEILRHDRIA